MPSVKTAISLDRDLLAQAEVAAAELKTTRSGLVARALTEFLARRRDEEITAKLNAVYRAESADEEETHVLDATLLLHREALGDDNPW